VQESRNQDSSSTKKEAYSRSFAIISLSHKIHCKYCIRSSNYYYYHNIMITFFLFSCCVETEVNMVGVRVFSLRLNLKRFTGAQLHSRPEATL
jgi:hypothetical protein